VNVDVFMPDVEVQPCTYATWADMLGRRLETFRGFATIEADKGFLRPTVSFHTSRGQEMVRILGFRVIEELTESLEAYDSRIHQLEELIDAFNYLISIPLLDPEVITIENLASRLFLSLEPDEPGLTIDDCFGIMEWFRSDEGYAWIVSKLAGKLGDSLRNRAWMEQTQDLYFSNSNLLLEIVASVARQIMRCFESWDEFYTYFIAKDEVLKFRLRSHY
jgi:hypothetical protein